MVVVSAYRIHSGRNPVAKVLQVVFGFGILASPDSSDLTPVGYSLLEITAYRMIMHLVSCSSNKVNEALAILRNPEIQHNNEEIECGYQRGAVFILGTSYLSFS